MKLTLGAKILTGLLVVQFILGMLANFYAVVPAHHPNVVFSQPGWIFFHSLVAVILLLLALWFWWRAVKTKELVALASGGLFGIALAFLAGHIFVETQKDIYSFVMALGFLISFGAYLGASFTPLQYRGEQTATRR